jgi:polyferredoxin
MVAYTVVLSLLVGVLATLLLTRQDISANVLRARGMLYQIQPNAQVSNLYNIKLLNKTRKDIPVTLKMENGFHGTIKMVGNDLTVKKESVGDGMFFIYADSADLKQRKNNVEVGVYTDNKKVSSIKTTFFAPSN